MNTSVSFYDQYLYCTVFYQLTSSYLHLQYEIHGKQLLVFVQTAGGQTVGLSLMKSVCLSLKNGQTMLCCHIAQLYSSVRSGRQTEQCILSSIMYIGLFLETNIKIS